MTLRRTLPKLVPVSLAVLTALALATTSLKPRERQVPLLDGSRAWLKVSFPRLDG